MKQILKRLFNWFRNFWYRLTVDKKDSDSTSNQSEESVESSNNDFERYWSYNAVW
jgi:hypothetical protein